MPSSMPQSLAFLAAGALVLAFAWAALAKVVAFERWRRALAGYRLPPALERAARYATPVAEGVVAVIALAGPLEVAGALALALLAAFCIAILHARTAQGDRLPCGCFGGASERDFRLLLVRNGLLVLPAGIVSLAGGNGLIVRLWSVDRSELLPAAFTLVALVLVAGILWGMAGAISTRGRRT